MVTAARPANSHCPRPAECLYRRWGRGRHPLRRLLVQALRHSQREECAPWTYQTHLFYPLSNRSRRLRSCFRLERSPGGACTHWKGAALSRRTWKADVREWASITLSGRGCPIGYAVRDYCAALSRPITVSIVSAIRAKAEVRVAQAHDTAATMASASSCHVGPLPGPSIRSSFPFRGPGSDL